MKNFKLGIVPNNNFTYKIKRIAITSGIILSLATTGCGAKKNKDGYYEKDVCATKIDYEIIETNLEELENIENIEYFIIDKNNNKSIEKDVEAIKKIIEKGKTKNLYLYLSYENTYHFQSKEEYIDHCNNILLQLDKNNIKYIIIGDEDVLSSLNIEEKYPISDNKELKKRYKDGKILSKEKFKKQDFQNSEGFVKDENQSTKKEEKSTEKDESKKEEEKKEEKNNKKEEKKYDENGWELVNEEIYYKGIDVSEHQGEINWKKAKDDIDYAIIRVADSYNKDENGNIIVDHYYHRNMQECMKYNIHVGIYLFTRATTEKKIEKEIEFVYNNLTNKDGKPYKISLPIYIDIEEEVAERLRNPKTRKEQIKYIRKFCQYFEDLGYSVGIYINSNDLCTIDELREFTTWLAGGWLYNVENNTERMLLRHESRINEDGNLEINVSETTYWSPAAQTNSKTQVSGIKGDVDGDYAEKEFYDALIRLSEEKQKEIENNLKRNR